METLITTLYAMVVVLGNVAQVCAWLLIVVGPAFLIGNAIYKLATMSKSNKPLISSPIPVRNYTSAEEIRYRAEIFAAKQRADAVQKALRK